MKDLKLIDPATGITENCGVIAAKRSIGTATVYLTYREADKMWWIIIREQPHGLWKIGYLIDRREVAWETFRDLDDVELAKLKSN